MTPSSSRPHTPPSSSKSAGRFPQTPPPRPGSALSSPLKRLQNSSFLSQVDNDWISKEEDYDDEPDSAYKYNDDGEEDEFGLPSLTKMRKDTKRVPVSSFNNDPGGISAKVSNGFATLAVGSTGNRARANSSDIAEVRETPVYPTTKQSDGKILRPQYKEILRGKSNERGISINDG